MEVAALALRLYRDPALVTALLGEDRTGASASRLRSPPEPPRRHAIVARNTCLGSGMSVGDRPVVRHEPVRLHVERADLFAERGKHAPPSCGLAARLILGRERDCATSWLSWRYVLGCRGVRTAARKILHPPLPVPTRWPRIGKPRTPPAADRDRQRPSGILLRRGSPVAACVVELPVHFDDDPHVVGQQEQTRCGSEATHQCPVRGQCADPNGAKLPAAARGGADRGAERAEELSEEEPLRRRVGGDRVPQALVEALLRDVVVGSLSLGPPCLQGCPSESHRGNRTDGEEAGRVERWLS